MLLQQVQTLIVQVRVVVEYDCNRKCNDGWYANFDTNNRTSRYTITATIRATSGTSPSGTQSSYSTAALTATKRREYFNWVRIYSLIIQNSLHSQINETNELAGSKSMFLDLTMTSTKENLSPVIDLDRKSVVAFANRLNKIDSSSDVFPTSTYVAPIQPDGDSNEAIYCTKKVQLENPATAIKVLHSAVRFSGAD